MAFKPIDPKRDEYRRYLERGGIIESLTKVFVRILKERPEDPTQYLLQNLGDARLQADNIAYLQSELDDARNEIQRLTEIIRGINPDLLVEPSSHNESINNDNLNESNGAKEEGEDINMPPPVEQSHQPVGEYSEVAALEEGIQNTHITESNVQAVASGGGEAVQNEMVSTSAE
ncbi:putative c-Myc-binding protein [Lucilia cuprina]|uniref:Putative c-Myc-binding protein n=1 Tax=Lucilia cuprina TaxID=7375 RepID=A0A0L0CHE7_LUCCU|nr:putative c-Myc-binding protein [Lucilia cuprina]